MAWTHWKILTANFKDAVTKTHAHMAMSAMKPLTAAQHLRTLAIPTCPEEMDAKDPPRGACGSTTSLRRSALNSSTMVAEELPTSSRPRLLALKLAFNPAPMDFAHVECLHSQRKEKSLLRPALWMLLPLAQVEHLVSNPLPTSQSAANLSLPARTTVSHTTSLEPTLSSRVALNVTTVQKTSAVLNQQPSLDSTCAALSHNHLPWGLSAHFLHHQLQETENRMNQTASLSFSPTFPRAHHNSSAVDKAALSTRLETVQKTIFASVTLDSNKDLAAEPLHQSAVNADTSQCSSTKLKFKFAKLTSTAALKTLNAWPPVWPN